MSYLIKIDELHINQHSSLSLEDNCFYLLEYTARAGYAISQANDLIQNLKKPMDRKGKPEWKYKVMAISKISDELQKALSGIVNFENSTIIPIPPSKTRENPLYDDRVIQILRKACPNNADIRELITCNLDMKEAHLSNMRPTVQDLINNYQLNAAFGVPKKNIILFDDVIAGGNHYVACKKFLATYYPQSTFVGIFIARRVLPSSTAFDDFANI